MNGDQLQPVECPRGIPSRRYQMDVRGCEYCVYAHIFEGEVFYIGQGRLGRPFDLGSRNRHWWQYVHEIGSFTIEILGLFDTMTAARAEERRLILLLEPPCNLQGTSVLQDTVPVYWNIPPLRETAPALRLLHQKRRIQELEAHIQEREAEVLAGKKAVEVLTQELARTRGAMPTTLMARLRWLLWGGA